MQNKAISILLVVVIVLAIGVILYDKNKNRSTQPPADEIASENGDDIASGSDTTLIPDALVQVRISAALELNTTQEQVVMKSMTEKEWPDGCLGLARDGEMCTQVITPGYEIVVEAEGQTLTYRTNMDGTLVRKQ